MASDIKLLYHGEDPALEATCLDTFTAAFAADSSTGAAFYVGADEAGVHAEFWKRLIANYLQSAPAGERVLVAMHGGLAAAVCTLWTPEPTVESQPSSSHESLCQQIAIPHYSELLTPHGKQCFEECHGPGGLWPEACAGVHQRYGPFYSLDFLATHPSAVGRGYGDALLRYLTARADSEGKAMFLVGTSTRLSRWYGGKHGFQQLQYTKYTSPDGASAAELVVMERPPAQQQQQQQHKL